MEGSADRAPTLHQFLGPGICLTTEENHGKTSVRAPENNLDEIVGVFIREKVWLDNSLRQSERGGRGGACPNRETGCGGQGP